MAFQLGLDRTVDQLRDVRRDRIVPLFPALDPDDGVRATLLAYHVPQYLPGALPFAFNGEGTLYLFDMRQPAKGGEYPVVCSQAGNLGWEVDECLKIAKTFEAACHGTGNVEELW